MGRARVDASTVPILRKFVCRRVGRVGPVQWSRRNCERHRRPRPEPIRGITHCDADPNADCHAHLRGDSNAYADGRADNRPDADADAHSHADAGARCRRTRCKPVLALIHECRQ